MSSYVQPVAKDLLNIKRRHSLEITRAVGRCLRDSALTSRRQGKLNLDTVQTIYANNGAGFEQASTKLTTLVSRDNGQESERLSRREELISLSPTTDEDIVNLLSGFKIASKSYAAVVTNDPRRRMRMAIRPSHDRITMQAALAKTTAPAAGGAATTATAVATTIITDATNRGLLLDHVTTVDLTNAIAKTTA